MLTGKGAEVVHDVAPGVHCVTHGYTNCFVVETDSGVVLVDAAYPGTWGTVERCLRSIGRSTHDVQALLITHGHFDHLGFAAWLRHEHRVPIWAHPSDWPLLRRPYSYRPQRPRLWYPVRHPRALPVLTSMIAAGALRVPGVEPDHRLGDEPIPALGSDLEVIHTPGHTDGESVLVIPARDVAFTGDALVTLDPYTGRTGPRIIARAATHDRQQALRSLSGLADCSVRQVLPGHGAPWSQGLDSATALALRDGGA